MKKIIQQTQNIFQDFAALIFPNVCMACMNEAPIRNEQLCLACQVNLPYTNLHLHLENTFTDRLWARFPLYTASAQLLMIKGGFTENIIYNIKYKNAIELAETLGRQYGRILAKSNNYKDIDLIVPVPIHKSKMRTRGYNQSAIYGVGLAEGMGVPIIENALIKIRNTKSQTRKTRMERLQNVEGEYTIQNVDALNGKHVLLVDDVLTTGATIEACALEILKVPGTKISVVTIAMKNY